MGYIIPKEFFFFLIPIPLLFPAFLLPRILLMHSQIKKRTGEKGSVAVT